MATSSTFAPPARFALALGATLGVLGGAVGLALGLLTYPPTAWFAVLEVGVPAALAGAVLGLVVGLVVGGMAQRRPSGAQSRHGRSSRTLD